MYSLGPTFRLTSGGFEAVRVLIDGTGFADTSAQFLVHADSRVRLVFPRLSWGAEVGSGADAAACHSI